jgi:hypothetical protein
MPGTTRLGRTLAAKPDTAYANASGGRGESKQDATVE